VNVLLTEYRDLLAAFLETTTGALAGLVLSFCMGTLFAFGLSMSEFLRRAFLPYAIFFQTVPVIAIAPLLVIWFGFGMPTVIASAFIVSIFPIIASTLLGLQSTDPALLDLFRLYSASRFDYLFRLRVPFAMPYVFSGLRTASGLAVIGAVVGEFIGGGGLGSMVDVARTQQRVDQVFAAVLMTSLLGLALVALVNLFAHLVLQRWHASEHQLNRN
jgi:NitT/TauT family transport system permease protein